MTSYRNQKMRNRIRADYLAQSGREAFVKAEFLEWLAGRPNHECHDLFFGHEGTAPDQGGIFAQPRVSSLRIVTHFSEPVDTVVKIVVDLGRKKDRLPWVD